MSVHGNLKFLKKTINILVIISMHALSTAASIASAAGKAQQQLRIGPRWKIIDNVALNRDL